MGNWKVEQINIGNLKVGRKQIIRFEATEELKEISRLHSSCGCSKPNYDKKTRTLNVSYTPDKVPHQLKNQGWYKSSKFITVSYKDGTKDVLRFTAKVFEK